jgi:hypothetical protein
MPARAEEHRLANIASATQQMANRAHCVPLVLLQLSRCSPLRSPSRGDRKCRNRA